MQLKRRFLSVGKDLDEEDLVKLLGTPLVLVVHEILNRGVPRVEVPVAAREKTRGKVGYFYVKREDETNSVLRKLRAYFVPLDAKQKGFSTTDHLQATSTVSSPNPPASMKANTYDSKMLQVVSAIDALQTASMHP